MPTSSRVASVALLASVASLVAACARPAPRAPQAKPEPRASAAGPASPRAPSGRELAIRLSVENSRLHVTVAASGPAEELRAWRLGDDDVQGLDVRGAGDRPVAFRPAAHAVELTGDPRATTITLSYDVVAPAEASDDPRATRIETARVRCVGERVLALPSAFEDKPVDATIDVDAHTIDSPVAGSTFGVARRDRPARVSHIRGAEIRRSAFIAGGGGNAVFDAPEGHDEAVWLGFTAFDPRAVSAEVAGFRGVLHEYFHGMELEPATLLFAVDARPRGSFRALRRAGGVLVALSGSDPYDAPLRLAVAHELVHAWIGERIWLGEPTPGAEAMSYWFHEGFARWVAREQLARVGLLPSDDYAAEVNRLLSIVATSPKAAVPMKDLAGGGPGVVPLLVARGALYATVLDARIRDASKGKLSLDDAIRALTGKAAQRHGPLPADALDTAVSELGLNLGHADFDDIVAEGKRRKLPDNALGGCFEPRDTSYDVLTPGFDVAASRTSGKVSGVDPKGPAGVAGLRDGDTLIHVDGSFDRSDEPVRLEVARPGGPAVVTYKATSGTKNGQAFKRKEGLSETACRKLALRH